MNFHRQREGPSPGNERGNEGEYMLQVGGDARRMPAICWDFDECLKLAGMPTKAK
jgi:hypothetical protein